MTTKITGYKELTEEQIALMNEIKAKGNELKEMIEKLWAENSEDLDPRWLRIGETHLQQGLMALCRAIAQPDGF